MTSRWCCGEFWGEATRLRGRWRGVGLPLEVQPLLEYLEKVKTASWCLLEGLVGQVLSMPYAIQTTAFETSPEEEKYWWQAPNACLLFTPRTVLVVR